VSEGYILEAEGLTKSFRGFLAVEGVDLRVRQGTIHALIGPNGAGKTTLFNLITKMLAPSAGTIRFQGEDITAVAPAAIARRGLVRSFQISATFPGLSVRDNLLVALQRRDRELSLWRPAGGDAGLNAEADRLLERVGLRGLGEERAGELPYGRKRSLELATTLALDPKLLLLDEPMAGLAYEEIERITLLIRQIAAERTVLMVEHNLSVVAALCDRVTVLSRGRVLSEGDYASVAGDPRVIEAYIGAEDA
jgi:branched-chain amino acid transport system ATP-binding protein